MSSSRNPRHRKKTTIVPKPMITKARAKIPDRGGGLIPKMYNKQENACHLFSTKLHFIIKK